MKRIQTALKILAILNDCSIEDIRAEINDFLTSAAPEDIVLVLSQIINRKALDN